MAQAWTIQQKGREVYTEVDTSVSTVYGSPSGSADFRILKQAQHVTSENHPWKTLKGRNVDLGGPFFNRKVEIELSDGDVQSNQGWWPPLGSYAYSTKTRLIPHHDFNEYVQRDIAGQPPGIYDRSREQIETMLMSKVEGTSTAEMNALGTKAISITQPLSPAVDLATSLAELFAERKFFGLPGKNGGVAGEYLNYQFGIAPTLSDAQDLRAAISRNEEIIAQYKRDAGRWVRRRFVWDPEITSSSWSGSSYAIGAGLGLNTYQCPNPGSQTVDTRKTVKHWFSGAFQYALPAGSLPKSMAELDRLYGVKPGVSVGWELIPFSWLVDYFTPIGAMLETFDARVAGLVIPYAYVMSETEIVKDYTWDGTIATSDGSYQRKTVTGRITTTSKLRIPASPFGFGLLPTDLSPKQMSILAALGISLVTR